MKGADWSSFSSDKGLFAQMLRIASYARPYRNRIVVGVLLVLLGTVFSLVYPIVIAAVVDTAVGSGDRDLLHFLAAGVLLTFLIAAAVGFCGNYLLDSTGEYLVLDLRRALFAKLARLDVAFLNSQRVGDLTARLTADTASVRHAVTDTAVSLLNQGLMLVGSAAVMAYLNWKLAIIVMLLAPATTLVSRHYGRIFQDGSRESQRRNAQSNAVAHEAVSGIALVKSMSRERFEVDRYEAALRALQCVRISLVRTDAWYRGLVASLTSLGVVAIFWFGGLQVLAGGISAGELVAFLFYVQNISGCFGSFAQLYADLNQAAGASSRVFDLLDIEPRIVDGAGDEVVPDEAVSVVFEDVRFAYESSGSQVITGLDLTVPGGAVVALVGNSGCGKTSILHLLIRLYDACSGTIRIGGVDVRSLALDDLRRSVALVSQDVFLFSGSIRENIRYGRLEANNAEVEHAAMFAQAHDFITAFAKGYDTEVGDRGVKLSGGQRQRIALARAFLRRPRLLLLDEATSSVDYFIENRMLESVARWSRREGITTIIVTHRLNSIRTSNRIAVLEGGRLAEYGTYDELSVGDTSFRAMLESGILLEDEEGEVTGQSPDVLFQRQLLRAESAQATRA